MDGAKMNGSLRHQSNERAPKSNSYLIRILFNQIIIWWPFNWESWFDEFNSVTGNDLVLKKLCN